MALLGHMSAEMSLRYGRLFDATVRTEHERALDPKDLLLTTLRRKGPPHVGVSSQRRIWLALHALRVSISHLSCFAPVSVPEFFGLLNHSVLAFTYHPTSPKAASPRVPAIAFASGNCTLNQ